MFTIASLISYSRILLMFLSFAYFLKTGNQLHFFILTIIVIALDSLDGVVARKLKQETVFGAKLDIFADRLAELAYWFFFAYIGLIGYWIFWFFLARGIIVDYLTRKDDKPLGDSWLRSSRIMRGSYGTFKTLSFCALIMIPDYQALGFNLAHTVSYITVLLCFLRAVPVLFKR